LILGELIRDTEKRFLAAKLHYGHGTSNAQDEAAFLVLRGLDLPFDASLREEIGPGGQKRVESLIRKRIEERIPAAYLLKEAWLDGYRFYVDRRVIIPRSHIAFMLKRFGRPKRVLDLCTGSACLAILAAYAFPRARVDASDISADALQVAARNVKLHRLGKRIRLIRSDLFESIDPAYDLIVSNPPYVSAAAMAKLPAEYRYEPGLALAGGKNGLSLVEKIIDEAPAHLAPGGQLVCEVGDGRKGLARDRRLHWPIDEVFVYRKKVG
jgi:ribosomal protein L3 glutamine methyltransferase